jgi:hypothetical protein
MNSPPAASSLLSAQQREQTGWWQISALPLSGFCALHLLQALLG